MAINNTTNLGLALPVDGTESGTWGDAVNDGITTFLESAVCGTNTITVTTTDVTLGVTNYSTGTPVLTGTSSQYQVLRCIGAMTGNRSINLPNISKTYLIINDTTGGFALTFRGVTGPTAGVSTLQGFKGWIAWNGVDFTLIANQNAQFIPNTLQGIVGTTLGDNANSGSVGEVIQNTVTDLPISNLITSNVVSIALPAGDWDVYGAVAFKPAPSTTVSNPYVGISGSSNTLPAPPFTVNFPIAFATGTIFGLAAPMQRVNISTPTTYYLVVNITYAVSVLTATGNIMARRRR